MKAFNKLKDKITNSPVLKYTFPSLPYEVKSEASDTGIGAVFSKTGDKLNRPVDFMSKKLSSTEQNYGTPEKVLLRIIHSLRT